MPEAPITPAATFIPPLGDELLADDALAAVATQVPESTDYAATVEVPEPEVYGKTWAWDFSINRFTTVGSMPQPVWDIDNLRVWIQTVMNIERGVHPVLDEEIGMDEVYGQIANLATDTVVQDAYMQSTFDALLVHDRITDVTEFDFYTDPTTPGVVYVDFEVHTDNGDVLPITLGITE